MENVTRRNFLKGSAGIAAAGVAAGAMAGVAQAEEPVVITAQNCKDIKWAFEVMPAEYPIADDKITKTYTNDYVIVGAGLAGLTCAVSAKEAGADVRLFSASTKPIGRGGSNHAFASKAQIAAGIDYTPDTADGRRVVKMQKLAGSFFIDERKWSDWLAHSTEAINWTIDLMEDQGFSTALENGYDDPDGMLTCPQASVNFYDANGAGGALGGAPKVAQAYADIFTDLGGEIEFNVKALYLIREDDNKGRVSGVVAQDMLTGEYIRYNANKGVVLATGDFSRDADMMAKYAPWTWNLYKNCIATEEWDYDAGLTYNGLYHGDGHKMGLWVGAGWQKIFPCAPMINSPAPGPTQGSGNFPGINLASDGKRYHDEVSNFGFGAISILGLKDHIALTVWDADYANRYDSWSGMMGGSSTPEQQLQSWISSGERGSYFMADTIEELLAQMGFEGEAFDNAMKTIEDYNRYADQGCDEEYHVNPEMLRPVRTAPFFGNKTKFNMGGMYFLTVCGGLRTNEYLQVCEDDDTPIDGLFNTGIMVGDFYNGCYNFAMPGMNLGALDNCLSYVLGRRLADPDFKWQSGPIKRMSTVEDESVNNDGAMFRMFLG